MEQKPYFTKYLPDKGDIKKGDKFISLHDPSTKGKILECGDRRDVLIKDEPSVVGIKDSENFYFPREVQKVKLFLCSRDVEVGDKVYMNDGSEGIVKGFCCPCKDVVFVDEGKEYEFAEPYGSMFKIIGEVSLNAKWIKPDMEFNKEDIQAWGICFEDNHHFHNHGWMKGIPYNAQHSLAEITGCPYECDCEIDHRYFKFKCPCCGDFK